MIANEKNNTLSSRFICFLCFFPTLKLNFEGLHQIRYLEVICNILTNSTLVDVFYYSVNTGASTTNNE